MYYFCHPLNTSVKPGQNGWNSYFRTLQNKCQVERKKTRIQSTIRLVCEHFFFLPVSPHIDLSTIWNLDRKHRKKSARCAQKAMEITPKLAPCPCPFFSWHCHQKLQRQPAARTMRDGKRLPSAVDHHCLLLTFSFFHLIKPDTVSYVTS